MTSATSKRPDLNDITFTIGEHLGRKVWVASDGTILPYVSGGDDTTGNEGSGDNDGDGDADADGDEGSGDNDGDGDAGSGDGDSGSEDGDGDDTTDWKSETEKWKKLSRKHEDRAKHANREVQRLRREGMSPEHQALEDAKDEGRTEARVEFGQRLVEAEIRAQSAQRISETARDQLIDTLAHDKFLTDDGDVDTDKVKDLIEGLAGSATGSNSNGNGRKLDSGQGRRQGSSRKGERTASVATGRDLYEEMHGKTNK